MTWTVGGTWRQWLEITPIWKQVIMSQRVWGWWLSCTSESWLSCTRDNDVACTRGTDVAVQAVWTSAAHARCYSAIQAARHIWWPHVGWRRAGNVLWYEFLSSKFQMHATLEGLLHVRAVFMQTVGDFLLHFEMYLILRYEILNCTCTYTAALSL